VLVDENQEDKQDDQHAKDDPSRLVDSVTRLPQVAYRPSKPVGDGQAADGGNVHWSKRQAMRRRRSIISPPRPKSARLAGSGMTDGFETT
jgi:hypothetical protein